MSQGDVVVRPLTEGDDRTKFRSGNVDLDRFFVRYAGQNQFRHHIGTTWVAVTGPAIIGFFTVTAGHVELEQLPDELRRGLPAYPVAVLRLARLAVAADAHGSGVGRRMLRTVFALAHRMARDFGCVGVVVDAKPDAVGFYAALGFTTMVTRRGALGDRPEPLPMFLPLRDIPAPASAE